MANDTCPHCGAERRYMERYDCGTWHCATDLPSVTCYQRQLATVTAERDELKKQKELDDYHILKLQGVLEGSTKRNRQKRETIKTLQDQVGELQRRIDEAPVWWFNPADQGEPIAMIWEAAGSPAIRVRLVRDDQPEETAK